MKGHLFVMSAPSGAGKTTLCTSILKLMPDLEYSVSCTTRSPRQGEQDGVHYHFISREVFYDRMEQNDWVEWAEVYGNLYGTSAVFLKNALDAGKDVLLDIDVQGAKRIRARYPDATLIFIMPPSLEILRKRLVQRGCDSADSMANRLEAAQREMNKAVSYDVVIVNRDLNVAISGLNNTIKEIRNKSPEKSAGSAL
ncbi:MAG: guanylate kinase [Desulfobacterales bacterium C00003106]|jgi:guanylate kinase|nr:guanylate kinase [Desulfobacterales bacterium]OEU53255.1 MAG: guanylate kinase [Desulfobacterales bacterium C00003106]OEU60977.1 MAG: guanylate kinase [Desulfobacterales bacterium C00003104]